MKMSAEEEDEGVLAYAQVILIKYMDERQARCLESPRDRGPDTKKLMESQV